MDEIAGLIGKTGSARPLPPEFINRLEALMLDMGEEGAEILRSADRPRQLPPAFRDHLSDLMSKRTRRFLPGLQLPAPKMIIALGAAAALVLGIFAVDQGPQPSFPAKPSRPGETPIALGPPSEPIEQLPIVTGPKIPDPPAPKGKGTMGPSHQGSRSASGSSAEVCFPEEQCPVYAAYDSPGGSSPTPTAQRIPPSPPRDVLASSGPGLGEITITWSAPSTSGSSELRKYALYRQDEDGRERVVALLDPATTRYVDQGLSFGSYRYRLKVRNREAISEFSAQASAYALGAP